MLKEFSTHTVSGSDWQTKIMAQGEDITHKLAKIKNFTLFLDYESDHPKQQASNVFQVSSEPVSEATLQKKKLYDFDALKNDTSNELFKKILQCEFEVRNTEHNFIVDNFSMEARIRLNKNPLTNKEPQFTLDLLLGGQFKQKQEDICINLNIHQPQIIRVLKLLEYIGYYNEFQKGALTKFGRKPITQDLANEYIKLYCEWRMIKDNKKQSKEADEKRKLLLLIEEEYPSEKIIVLRKFGSKIVSQQEEQKQKEQEIEKQVKQLESQKKGWGFFTSKEKKEQQAKEVEEFRKQLQAQFTQDTQQQASDLDKELQLLTEDLSKQIVINNEDFDKMPEGYLRIRVKIIIPLLKFSFLNEFNQVIFISSIVDQQTTLDIGRVFSKINFWLYQISIQDTWTGATAFPTVLETREIDINGQIIDNPKDDEERKYALAFSFENNESYVICPFKIALVTQKTLFITANFHFIKEMKRTMINAFKGEQLDFSFYKDAASEKAIQFMYAGKEFIESIKKGEYKHQSFDVQLFLTAPVILVPENIFRPQNSCLVIDTGAIQLRSNLVGYNKDVDYKSIISPSTLYDVYEIKLTHFRINLLESGLEKGLSSYKKGQGIKVINEFNAKVNFYNCVEPMHPLYPTAELDVIIENFDLLLSLKLVENLVKIQNAVLEQLSTKEEEIFEQVTIQIKPSLQEIIGQELWRQVREANDMERVKKLQQNPEEDEFYDSISTDIYNQERLDELKDLEDKYQFKAGDTTQEINEGEEISKKKTQFKVFFSVEKLAIRLQKDNNADLLNILLLYFGIEINMDRNADMHLNLNIFKFIIEDIQQQAQIALPFRMILSSPMAEFQRPSYLESDSPQQFTYNQGVLRNSLTMIIQNGEEDEFKDAFDSEEMQSINEFELAVHIIKNNIDVNCNLSDIRFVFSVPTAKLLLDVAISLQKIFQEAEKEKLIERKVKLQLYEMVLSRLCMPSQNEEETLIQRVFLNHAKQNNLDPQVGEVVFKAGIQKLYQIWDVKEAQKKEKLDMYRTNNQFKNHKNNQKTEEPTWIALLKKHTNKVNERIDTIKEKVNVKARLTNFSIWIPLQAENERSQVMALSFKSDFSYNRQAETEHTIETSLNEVIRKELIESSDLIGFSISQLVIQMLQSNDYMNVLSTIRQTEFNEDNMNDNLSYTRMLQPCRINLGIDIQTNNKDKLQRNNINLSLEPIHLKIGFKHIDFFNIVLIQVMSSLDYLKQLTSEREGMDQEKTEIKQEIIQLKKDVEKEEKKIEDNKCVDLKRAFKFERYDSQAKQKIAITNVNLECDSFTLSLNEDSQYENHPLILARIQKVQLQVKIHDHQDDAATFMLKKLGIWQKRNPELAKEQMFRNINAYALVHVDYYNPRSLAFEPLMEPWHIVLVMSQLAPYTEQNLKVTSEKFLNLNLTFGMALTVRRIMDRIQESFDQAKIFQKDQHGEELNAEELDLSKEWKRRMLSLKEDKTSEIQSIQTFKAAFTFQNFTGLDLKAIVHDDLVDEDLEMKLVESGIDGSSVSGSFMSSGSDLDSKHNFAPVENALVFNGNNSNQTIKKAQEELAQIQKKIWIARNKGSILQSLQDDPLRMDFKLDGLQKLSSIPVEGLGIFSYRTTVIQKSDVKNQRGFVPFIKKKDNAKTVGLVFNIRMEGTQKKVSLESQLLIANNLQRPITIFVKNVQLEDFTVKEDQRAVIEPNSIFRVPLSWIYSEKKQSLFIEARALNQILLKNLDELFTDQLETSKLTEKDSQIIKLEQDYFCSMDIKSYRCLPKAQTNGPPQYVLSFNPPLQLSNYNFQPLEVRDAQKDSQGNKFIYALMGPKETAFLNMIDGYNHRPNLEWVFYENRNDTLALITQNFDLQARLNNPSAERFSNGAQSKKDQKYVKLIIEVRKVHYQDIPAYHENFELRERLSDFTSSCQVMIYPQYMIVNRTQMPFITDQINILPYTNEYFSLEQERMAFKVPGYKKSQGFDVNTVGISGVMSLDLEQSDLVIKDKLPQREYVPKKLDVGLTITTAPRPFNKTILISIVPRYLIVNQLGAPLVLKQKGQKSQVILKNQTTEFNFEFNKDQFLMIREPQNNELVSMTLGKGVYEDIANDENRFWSTAFSINDIDDFQVSYARDIRKNETEALWYLPNHDNNFMRFVRVIITTQNDATVLVVFTNPVFPEYEIVNKTELQLELIQTQSESMIASIKNIKRAPTMDSNLVSGEVYRIPPKVAVPYTWANRLIRNRVLALNIGGVTQVINIDQAQKKNVFKVSNELQYNVEVRVTGNAKLIKISNIQTASESNEQAKYLQHLLKRYQGSQMNVGLELKGIGLSFIDDSPQELLFLSIYDMRVQLQKWLEPREDGSGIIEQVTKLKLHLQHLQLDNMINQIMPVVLAPSKPLNKTNAQNLIETGLKPIQEIEETKEEAKSGDQKYAMVTNETDETPFIQLIIIMAESHGQKEKTTQRRLRALQFAIQEFIFQVETSIINSNLKFVIELVQTLANEKTYKVLLANTESFERSKQQSREMICEELDAKRSLIEKGEDIQANKMFIELIHLGAIKAIITFKLEKKAVTLNATDPTHAFGAFNVIYSLVAGVASISNSNLAFRELILLDTFAQPDILVKQIGKNYSRQALMQFYKLLGSSDLIGNPMGLVDKLGTGVYEFVSEPAKGLLKGPDEFVGGVGKGVQSLVTNVVSGGFESFSKITGSMYSVVKNISGDKNAQIKKSEGLGEGLYEGVKGGVTELFGGVTGIFTKPIQQTKQEGAKGFFKGLGSGFVGAITSPVTATLRAGSSITQGVSATATSIGTNTKEQIDTRSLYSRFRPPRYISARNVISVYDENLAYVSQILAQKYNGRYADQTIRHFVNLPHTKSGGEIVDADSNATILIITDSMIIYLQIEKSGPKKGQPHHIFKSRLRKIKKCEVYQASPGNPRQPALYALVVTCFSQLKGIKNYMFLSSDYTKFEKVYTLLSVLPQCDAEDRVKSIKRGATSKVLEQLF